jgi:ABC-type transporter Mla MlaB component
VARPGQLEVRLSGAYRIQALDRLIRDLDPLVTLTRPARVSVDLSRLVAVGPAALALLTAVLTRGPPD